MATAKLRIAEEYELDPDIKWLGQANKKFRRKKRQVAEKFDQIDNKLKTRFPAGWTASCLSSGQLENFNAQY